MSLREQAVSAEEKLKPWEERFGFLFVAVAIGATAYRIWTQWGNFAGVWFGKPKADGSGAGFFEAYWACAGNGGNWLTFVMAVITFLAVPYLLLSLSWRIVSAPITIGRQHGAIKCFGIISIYAGIIIGACALLLGSNIYDETLTKLRDMAHHNERNQETYAQIATSFGSPAAHLEDAKQQAKEVRQSLEREISERRQTQQSSRLTWLLVAGICLIFGAILLK